MFFFAFFSPLLTSPSSFPLTVLRFPGLQTSVVGFVHATYCHSSINVWNTHFGVLLIEVEPP